MKAIHGNGEDGVMTLYIENVNGLQQHGKWAMLQILDYDVKVLVETHATSFTQKSFPTTLRAVTFCGGIPWRKETARES